jgi:hypothetical protein
LRRFTKIIICLTLCLSAAPAFAEDADTPAGNPPEKSSSAETDQKIADQEIIEIAEVLQMMELLREMELMRDYHLFAEEKTDETEN